MSCILGLTCNKFSLSALNYADIFFNTGSSQLVLYCHKRPSSLAHVIYGVLNKLKTRYHIFFCLILEIDLCLLPKKK